RVALGAALQPNHFDRHLAPLLLKRSRHPEGLSREAGPKESAREIGTTAAPVDPEALAFRYSDTSELITACGEIRRAPPHRAAIRTRPPSRESAPIPFLAPALIFMAAVFLSPLIFVAYTSLVGDQGFSLAYYAQILT